MMEPVSFDAKLQRGGPLGTITMSVEHLTWLLRRCAAGEDPDLVLVEEVANAEHGPLRDFIAKYVVQEAD